MARGSRYDPDYSASGRFYFSPTLAPALRDSAQRVASTAKRLTKDKTGRHKRSIRAGTSPVRGGRKNDRIAYEVVADAPYSSYVEFGGFTRKGTHVEGDHALRRAVALVSKGRK